MHKRANEAFSAAGKCGIAEAGEYLGQAYCYGWGVQVNETRGWMLIREAVRNDPNSAVNGLAMKLNARTYDR
jgi:TPR repeat protein